MKTAVLFIFAVFVFLFSCKKDSFISSADARISISADTLHFDTVFTTAGSITQSFKIINENNQKLRLSSVKLMGGAGSNYKMNVDGIATVEATGIEIEASDSVYVFVQVNVDPAAGNIPFIIQDSIQVSFNGNKKLVQLEAWGQNAHFFRNREITTSETWTNDLPYVIQGYLYVDINQKLTIEKGCRIYVHADAPIIVDGSLKVNGEKDTINRVYFRGDRLDESYSNFPAGWPGIFFRAPSKDNILKYAVIKNAYQSLALEGPSVNAAPKLQLDECIIDNSYDAGIIALGSSIKATNCLISNCGKNIAIGKGGNYEFTHCTVASYSNRYIQHKDPVVMLSDADGSGTARLDAIFRNCIFWGESELVPNEVVVEKKGSPGTVTFDQVLWRVKTEPANVTLVPPQPINNQSPQFDSIDASRHYYDFRLNTRNSPAIDAGNNAAVFMDLDGKPRPVGLKPDLGCFEKQ
ncbi:MAG: choice-of-anchor Q domain-containing protein [Chitinophagaceae bacterium]